jgi:hypothetical protein
MGSAGGPACSRNLDNGALRVAQGACPNLLAEAQLYRYDPTPAPKTPKNKTTMPSATSSASSIGKNSARPEDAVRPKSHHRPHL